MENAQRKETGNDIKPLEPQIQSSVKMHIFCLCSVFILPCSVFEAELADTIPVIHASLAGCRIIGRMCVGKCVDLDTI
jgi:hypothetical protein